MSKRPLREGLIAHEEIEVGDICNHCFWRNPSCLLWKYRTPRSCKAIVDLLASEPTTFFESSAKVFTVVLECVANHDWRTQGKQYYYVKIKSIRGQIISRRRTTWHVYHEWLTKRGKEEEEANRHKNIYDQIKLRGFIAPANPWGKAL